MQSIKYYNPKSSKILIRLHGNIMQLGYFNIMFTRIIGWVSGIRPPAIRWNYGASAILSGTFSPLILFDLYFLVWFDNEFWSSGHGVVRRVCLNWSLFLVAYVQGLDGHEFVLRRLRFNDLIIDQVIYHGLFFFYFEFFNQVLVWHVVSIFYNLINRIN